MSRSVTPEDLEKFHVRDVYDQIAPHFVGSRHKAWPKVEAFLRSLPAGSLVVDVGCGTGRYLGLALDSVMIMGSDSCMKFAEIATRKGHSVVACDNQCLPYKDDCCDAVISIGVIHHFASAKRRIKALQELYRILRPGGRMLVYVWALEQNQRKFDGQDVLVPYTHHQRTRARRRSQSIPTSLRPRRKSLTDIRGSSHESTPSWRTRRTVSCDDSCSGQNHERPGKESLPKPPLSAVQVRQNGSKYSVLQHLRNGGSVSSLNHTQNLAQSVATERTPVSKLRKFFAHVLEKLFDDKEPRDKSSDGQGGEAQTNKVSMDGITDVHTKLSTLTAYFSSENKEKYFKVEFLSLLAKKLLSNKEELHLNNATQETESSETGQELPPIENGDRNSCPVNDVVVFMTQRSSGQPPDCAPPGDRKDEMNGMGLSVVARLMESLATPSDIDSDSSSSSDCLTSDSSAVEDWDRAGSTMAPHSNQAFPHTAVNCQDAEEDCDDAQPSSSEDGLSSSSSSSTPSSSSSPSLTSSSSSLAESLSQSKPIKSKLCQRYYHVFCAGELVRLVQEGIPSAVLLNEYYDHGNWAVVLEKAKV